MKKNSLTLFAHSYWDAIPVSWGLLHFAYFIGMLVGFSYLPWWANLMTGLFYAFSISWNVNSVSHNFIHNAYFNSNILNRAFSLLESITLGFSQTMYDHVHRQHHIGNNDRIGADGKTVDWISFYQHGKNGKPEPALKYALLSFFRDDPKRISQGIRRLNPFLAKFATFELVLVFVMIGSLFLINWKLGLFFIGFHYLGHSLTAMNGYYEHFGANPDKPIAWGVSCYQPLFNWLWLNNGYHAEHHYRPKHHWTQMKTLHQTIATKQIEAGVRVIGWPHQFGFLNTINNNNTTKGEH
ncbi:MAG: fatty acid desaturase [Pseudomonadota bacterium]